MIKNIIFDWSGTLSDDLLHVYKATVMAFRALGGKEIPLERFLAEFELPYMNFWHKHFPGLTLAEEKEAFLSAWDSLPLPAPFPEAGMTLEALHQTGIEKIVLSSHDQERLEREIGAYGFSRYFREVNGSVHDKVEAIGAIMRRNNFEPGETMIVGDMSHDIAAGRAAGIDTTAVVRNTAPFVYESRREIMDAKPNNVIFTLAALPILISLPPEAE